MVRAILELIRILVIFFVIGGLMGAFIKFIYTLLGIDVDNTNGGWLVGVSVFLLVFVLYRNHFQFSGFYQGKGNEKLPKPVFVVIMICSFLLIIIAPFFR